MEEPEGDGKTVDQEKDENNNDKKKNTLFKGFLAALKIKENENVILRFLFSVNSFISSLIISFGNSTRSNLRS